MQTTAIRQHLTKIAALAALVGAFGSAWADETIGTQSVTARVASAELADLEEAFWICDYTASIHGTSGTDTAACTAVYEAVKERKFGGDFDKLLDWWRQHKPARHEALATADAKVAPR